MSHKYVMTFIILSLTLLLCMGGSNDVAAQQRPERPKEAVTAPTTGMEDTTTSPVVKLWTDKGDNTDNNIPVYYVGEQIYISFQVNKDCYLTLYNIDTTGNVNVMFPNAYHKDNFVRQGRIYTIPTENSGFDLIIKGPTGEELLYAIASSHVFYHWQYGVSPPPIWSDEWGSPATWGHDGPYDQSVASRRFQKRLQMQENMADKVVEYIKHDLQLAKPLMVGERQCRFYVTVSPY